MRVTTTTIPARTTATLETDDGFEIGGNVHRLGQSVVLGSH